MLSFYKILKVFSKQSRLVMRSKRSFFTAKISALICHYCFVFLFCYSCSCLAWYACERMWLLYTLLIGAWWSLALGSDNVHVVFILFLNKIFILKLQCVLCDYFVIVIVFFHSQLLLLLLFFQNEKGTVKLTFRCFSIVSLFQKNQLTQWFSFNFSLSFLIN